MVYLIFLLLNLYASISGFKDSILYSRKAADATIYNEHILYVLERGIVLLIVIICPIVSMLDAISLLIPFILSFSFSHNQSYYAGRSIIDNTPYTFKYDSTTSTAKLELNYKTRTILAIIGIIILLITQIWLIPIL